MRSTALGVTVVLAVPACALARPLVLADGGETAYCIVVADDGTAPERHAAEELSHFLLEVTRADFPIVGPADVGGRPRILVGQGAHVEAVLPECDWASLGSDGLIKRTVGSDLILAGGRPRGTLYAVYDFLEDEVGCRWWTSSASTIPLKRRLVVPELAVREVPVLEYREPFWFDAFDGDWAVRNRANGNTARLDEARGGKHVYKGFVHTFYPLVPPEEHFATHPEWYSEIGGVRRADGGQLCTTNPELTAFVIERVKQWLRESPEATIISLSQNDWGGRCECANCRALEEAEGSPSGPLLHFVNQVAEAIEPEFPQVAIDTLAYQYTRKPPLHVRPRGNVIVRLCSIECSFADPLGTGDTNRSFAEDIEGWSKVCNRLYIWDYTTNFAHYLLPHPNLRVLGPNVRFFVRNGVRGIFEQGAYTSAGAEFAELRAWVLAKLLWDPEQGDQALIDEFLAGYYGQAAGPIGAYIKLMHDSCEVSDHYLSCFSSAQAPFLNLEVLTEAKRLFAEAERLVAANAELLNRVRMAEVPVDYVFAIRWGELQQSAKLQGLDWPIGESRADFSRRMIELLRANGATMHSEGSRLEALEQKLYGMPRQEAGPPPGCEDLPIGDYLDLQDDGFSLYREGELSALAADPSASDGVAARMPATHIEWAVQQALGVPTDGTMDRWTVCVVIRGDVRGQEGPAFSFGLWDSANGQPVASHAVGCADLADSSYQVYEIATISLKPGLLLWVAPANNEANIEAVWVDRFFLKRAE